MNTRGFTLIELLVVLLLIGILANLAIPGVQGVKRRSQAAAVIADVKVIETALLDYFASNTEMPQNSGKGQVPRGLSPSLPDGFSFTTEMVTYRWKRFRGRGQRRRDELGTIEIESNDRDLIRSIKSLSLGRTTGKGKKLTLIIE